MTLYAFIFARGGSKGLPGKNIKELGGKPLLAHSIQLAKMIEGVEGVFVSTDSKDIANVAEEYGAEVIVRPDELAGDTASEWDAWRHAIHYLRDSGRDFDIFMSLPTTSPLRNEEDVNNCLQALDDDTDIVITVTPASRSPYFNMVTREQDGASNIVLGAGGFRRRQDVPPVYDITTVAYVTRPSFVLEHDGIFAGRVKSVIVPKERSIDIDDEIDFRLAEVLYKNGK